MRLSFTPILFPRLGILSNEKIKYLHTQYSNTMASSLEQKNDFSSNEKELLLQKIKEMEQKLSEYKKDDDEKEKKKLKIPIGNMEKYFNCYQELPYETYRFRITPYVDIFPIIGKKYLS